MSSDPILSPAADPGYQGHCHLSVQRACIHGPVGVAVLDRETRESIRFSEVFRERCPRLLEQLEQSFQIVGAPIGNGLRSQDGLEKLLDRLLAMEAENFADSTVQENGIEEPLVLLSFFQEEPGVLP